MASSSKSSVLNIILLVAAIGALFAAYKFSTNKPVKPISGLPYYGPKAYNASTKDTEYHTVHNFKLTSEMGHTITLDSFKNKIFVANFFFATCPGICKKMNYELEMATKQFAHNPMVKFISYTVDPKDDSVPVLKQYAEQHDAIPYQWYFLTGNKDSIYSLARISYFAAVADSGARNFVHTENMTLVDMQHHIRGFYHGTDSADVAKMVNDIKVLLKESQE